MEIDKNCVALVTGASSGIGLETALLLASKGVKVALLARRKNLLLELQTKIRELGGEALVLQCDVTNREEATKAVHKTVEHFGKIDVLINNAGLGHLGYIEDTPQEHIINIFDVNVFSLWHTSSAALEFMRLRGNGHIINISSMAGKIGFPANAVYVAAKHAVVGFNRALRAELYGTNIHATVVLPAGVTTDWALNTQGGSMLELFNYEAKRGLEIAKEKNIELPQIPLLSPLQVAEQIIECIKNPVAELYTHPNTKELAVQNEVRPEIVETLLSPMWLANREGYLHMRNNLNEVNPDDTFDANSDKKNFG